MDKKQIFATLDIADSEVRLLVGEFHETRFNVLRIERAKVEGIHNKVIVNEANVIQSIMKVVHQAKDALGFRINRVLMSLPSIDVTRFNKRVNVFTEDNARRVSLAHIQKGLNEAISYRPDPELELVNVGCMKYITNGITSRKMPIHEICDVVTMNIDLLYANKQIVYSYARCVEKAGLEIIDICLDSYAIAEEAALFEQTVDKYVVLIHLEKSTTTLSLFTHGKLVNCELLEEGYANWLKPLNELYHIPIDVAFRIVQNSCVLNEAEISDNVLYIWSENKESCQLTERNVYDCIYEPVHNWIQMVNEACQPIIDSGEVRYVLTGEGFEIQELDHVISNFNAKAQIYVPQTIGARESTFTTCLGLFYNWKSQMEIRHDKRTSCDMNDVKKVVDGASKASTDDEGGFTKKLKSILLNEK